jgi:DNA replication protein DnaC
MLYYMRKFISSSDMRDSRKSSSQASPELDRIFEQIVKVPFLVVDDIGEQSNSAWVNENLYHLVNYRYNSNLPTVFTLIDGRDKVQEWLLSKLVDQRLSKVVYMPKVDLRVVKEAKRLR